MVRLSVAATLTALALFALTASGLASTPQAVNAAAPAPATNHAARPLAGAYKALASSPRLARKPGPIAGKGYHLAFKDGFRRLRAHIWAKHQWWEPRPPRHTAFARNGKLHIVRRAPDYPNVTVTSEPHGRHHGKSFRQGYFEARIRYNTVRGNGPAFWLFSTAHATNPNWPNPACGQPTCLSAELDIFEGFGNIQYGGARTDDFFSGTLHRNSCGCYGTPDSARYVQHGTGLDLSRWHVYAARWTANTVSYYVDGHLQGSVSTFDSTNQRMHLLLYNWNTDWEDENMPDASTPDTLAARVDWVRVWRR